MLAYSVLLLAVLVGALPRTPIDPPVDRPQTSIRLSRRIRSSPGNIAEHDRARAAHLYNTGTDHANGQPEKSQGSTPVTNQVVTYVAEVGVGSPPTNYSLIIDTGSSNTWVGAGKAYNASNTTQCAVPLDLVQVTYGSGLFLGMECNDTITFAQTSMPNLVVENQSIGNAAVAVGFDGFDGILGIGPTNLTEGTVYPTGTAVPTVTDNLFLQGNIPEKVVGIYFAPTTTESDTNGQMTFGGVDDTKTTGPVTYAPITSTSPASEFFGIDQDITYGDEGAPVLGLTAGIVDTGTTLVLVDTDALSAYQFLTGATEDQTTGLLTISPVDYANLQSLFFNIAGTTFEFTKNAQTWPRALNADIGGSPDSIYLIIGDLGTLSGSGLNFILGMTFLERYYSVYDSSNNRVGLAPTEHTFGTTN